MVRVSPGAARPELLDILTADFAAIRIST